MEEQTEQFRVYKRRWVVLALYSLYCTVNAVQWLQYSIIADVVVEYYQVSYTAVNWTSIIYMLAYVVTILPGTWFFNKTVRKSTSKFAPFYSKNIKFCIGNQAINITGDWRHLHWILDKSSFRSSRPILGDFFGSNFPGPESSVRLQHSYPTGRHLVRSQPSFYCLLNRGVRIDGKNYYTKIKYISTDVFGMGHTINAKSGLLQLGNALGMWMPTAIVPQIDSGLQKVGAGLSNMFYINAITSSIIFALQLLCEWNAATAQFTLLIPPRRDCVLAFCSLCCALLSQSW
jgi:hypothetical protein